METMSGRLELSVSAATNLWIQWAWIALDHRDEAQAARERDGGPPANNPELQASMISIAAAAFAIDGFATIVREHGAEPTLNPGPKPPGRAVIVWETLRTNFDIGAHTQTWPRALKQLWLLRSGADGGLAHPRTVAAHPVPLPAYSQAPARMTYTIDKAAWSSSLMAEIVTACNSGTIRHGINHELVRLLEGLTTYIDEFTRRGAADGSTKYHGC
jgi:hypothetical protein